MLVLAFSIKSAQAQPSPPPVINVTGFTGNISACVGSASTSLQQFTVSGSNLTSPISLTISSVGFQISLNSLTGFDTSLLLTPTIGLITSTTIYVRSSANAPTGSLSGSVVISSTGAITQSIPVTALIYAFPNVPIITSSKSFTICSGDSTVLKSNITSGNQWFYNGTAITGANKDSCIVMQAGSYSVLNTNAGGCKTNSSSYTLAINSKPNAPVITSKNATVFCAGLSDTLLSNVVSGNQWFLNGIPINGAINNNYVVTIGGNYAVTTTINSCSSVQSSIISITVNPIPGTPVITSKNPTTFCNGLSDTLVSSVISGNQWYLNGIAIGGATSNNYVAKTAGNYANTTTLNSCTSAQSSVVSIFVNENPVAPVITSKNSTIICTGVTDTLISNSNIGNQWFLNGLPIAGATNDKYVATSIGNYAVTTTINSCGSVLSNSISITANVAPVITASGLTTVCPGNSVSLNSNSAFGNQWYKDSVLINGATSSVYKAFETGKYTVSSTINGCPSLISNSILVTINSIVPKPLISPGTDTSICIGKSIKLSSNIEKGNQWYINGFPIAAETGQDLIVSDSGFYSVKVSINGCSSEASKPIFVKINTIPVPPSVSANTKTTFCSGDSVVLVSDVSTGNQWYMNGLPISGAKNLNYVAKISGNYAVTTVINSCESKINSNVFVNVNPIPSLPVISSNGPNSFCLGGSVLLTSNTTVSNQWFKDSVLSAVIGTGATITVSSAGAYRAKATNNFGCSSISSPFEVTVLPLPVIPLITVAGSTTICSGTGVLLSIDAGLLIIKWLKDSTMIIGASNSTYNASTSGKYSVTVTNSSGCSAISLPTQITVSEYPSAPVISASGSMTVCSGTGVLLSSNAVSGNQWYLDNVLISGATFSGYNATQTGVYTVRVTNIAGCSTESTNSLSVTVNPLPAIPIITAGGPIAICNGDNVILSSNAATNNQWYKDLLPVGGATNTTYSVTVSGSYSVKTTNTLGCSATSAPLVVTVNPIPVKPVVIQNGTNMVSSSSSGNQWYQNLTIIPGATNTTYRPTLSGYYKTQVTINGCSSPMSDPYYYLITAISNSSMANTSSYKLYPNPITDRLFIDAAIFSNKINVQIIDNLGSVIFDTNFIKNTSINLQAYKSGIFTVILTDSKTKAKESRKIIKL